MSYATTLLIQITNHSITVQTRSNFIGLSPVEFAASQNDIEMLSMLVGAVPRSKANNFESYKESLADALESLPDLSMEMYFNCDSSFIPFVKSFAPSDVYKVAWEWHKVCRFTSGVIH